MTYREASRKLNKLGCQELPRRGGGSHRNLLKAPALMVVEAKQENIPGGFGQCIAEMVAARIFNERAGNEIRTVYGAVTSGDNWKFLKLEGDRVFIDLTQYQIAQLGKILGVLVYILQDDQVAESIAA